MLEEGVIVPVDGSMVKPGVDEYVPPAAPDRDTFDEAPDVHSAG